MSESGDRLRVRLPHSDLHTSIRVCDTEGLTMVLDDGRTTEELEATFAKLHILAQVLCPTLARNMERGIFDPLTDNDAIKVKLMVMVSEIR